MSRGLRLLAAGGRFGFVRGLSRADRSAVGTYWNAVKRFLSTGDETRLWEVRRDLIARNGSPTVGGIELEFSLDAIEELAEPLDDRFESLYEDGER